MTSPGPQVLDVLDIARELVRIPSPNPPGDERAVAALVHDLLPALQLPRAEVIARDESRPNLWVTLDFGAGGRHLVLSGHLDTKPVGDATWGVDPFAADVEGYSRLMRADEVGTLRTLTAHREVTGSLPSTGAASPTRQATACLPSSRAWCTR